LVKIGLDAEDKATGIKERTRSNLNHIFATAIRDRVLVGVAGEKEQIVSALIEAKRQRDVLASKLITHGVSVRDLCSEGDDKPFGGWHFEDGYKIVPNREPSENIGELPTPAPTPDQVEALASDMRAAWAIQQEEIASDYDVSDFAVYARAAFAHFGVEVPSVDPDAWKTPMRVEDTSGDAITTRRAGEFSILVECDDDGVSLTPEKAARVALHLASYAAAHGCQVDLRTPEQKAFSQGVGVDLSPIAPADTLEKLAEIGYNALREAYIKSGHTVGLTWQRMDDETKDSYMDGVAAILRAAKARVGVDWAALLNKRNQLTSRNHTDSKEDYQEIIDWLNQNITFGVEVPSVEDRDALINAIREEIYATEFGADAPIWTGPTRAEAKAKWTEMRARGGTYWEDWKDAWNWLLPLLPETAGAGWELDVTAEDLVVEVGYLAGLTPGEALEVIEYFKERIRPAACKECAKKEGKCCPCCDESEKYDGEDCQICGFSFSSRTVPSDETVKEIKASRAANTCAKCAKIRPWAEMVINMGDAARAALEGE